MRRGLVTTRESAQEAIGAGRVLVGGAVAQKPAHQVAPGDPIEVVGPPPRFVSRGGEKLDSALDRFGVDVAGRAALDAGASTGGFTDVLLQRGAAVVVAVDVGHGQLHERVKADRRVRVVDRTNVRHLTPDDLPESPFDIVVADLSFISLRSVLGALVGLAKDGADLVLLVKPQFEAGRAAVSRGRGIVRDPADWRAALEGVVAALADAGAAMMGTMASPLRGTEGNVEFLLHARAHAGRPRTAGRPDPAETIDAAIAEGERLAGGSREA